MTAVEALASGKAVIALGRGGALEIASEQPPLSGVFYSAPVENLLGEAVARFEKIETEIQPDSLRARAQRIDEAEFMRSMRELLGLTRN